MGKILGLDLGTNSIGWTIRNEDLAGNQFEKFGVTTFNKGVGTGKTGEFSFAAERTKNRSTRRLYQARKYRIWETLAVLIENNCCPLTLDELNKWRKYDKSKGLFRQYPIDSIAFEQWVRLDFDGDEMPDYNSPYQLRKELAKQQIDFTIEINRFKLGRALYHIAQRRGFKSSKGEVAKEQAENLQKINVENDQDEVIIDLKKSELKRSKKIADYIEVRKAEGVELPTVGCVLADLESNGERVREQWVSATLRQHYEEEIQYIFKLQNQLPVDSDFYKSIYKAIFYKRPLRSQKGLVGKCTLEPNKYRCPVSHPDFETFRAWSFINNIQYKDDNTTWQSLNLEIKQKLFDKLFIRTKPNFNFVEIIEFLNKELGSFKQYNYRNKTNVSACPISARLKNLFGDDWKNFNKVSSKIRTNKNGQHHTVKYDIYDIWHVLFSFEDIECVQGFSADELELNDKEIKSFSTLWSAISQGYSMLSLKAIRNINRFLTQGFIYTEAALLAKLPDILGEKLWVENEVLFTTEISLLINKNREEKRILNIVNNLISKYKALEIIEQFAYKNTSYQLDELDKKEINKTIIESIGKKKWDERNEIEKEEIRLKVKDLYQDFFSSSKRDYNKLPRLSDTLKGFIYDNFPTILEKEINKLYHPSQIEIYPEARPQSVDVNGNALSLRLLESPKTGAFKNPMAMRALHELRKLINYLIVSGQIDEETRIVVETARDLNDANKRWAIETYQRHREEENKAFADAIRELVNDKSFNGNVDPENVEDIDKIRLLTDQCDVLEAGPFSLDINSDKKAAKKKSLEKVESFNRSPEFLKKIAAEKVDKYRLWKEQSFRCVYTGKMISISDLFSDNLIDFEHTLPLSQSFDNSLANLTVCYADFNRNIKENKIPADLNNHEEILRRIQPWFERIEKLKDNIEYWKKKSKGAAVKDDKDYAIRQRHLWQMELDYWQNKVDRFSIKEITSGFKNSQLVDTQLISKYAFHYLKSVFSSVTVQKGIITAEFRKIFGIYAANEKKSRDQHSHHAIDAAVLTLIPVTGKRDLILERTFRLKEQTYGNVQYTEKPYPSFDYKHIASIKDEILINNVVKDQTLTPAIRKERKRGKLVYWVDQNGNKHEKIITGDCIRGQLHQETFLGAIKKPILDEKGAFQRNSDGSIIVDDKLYFVKREKMVFKTSNSTEGFMSLDDLKSKIVDQHLFSMIKQQCQDKVFKDAIVEGFWMIDKKGDKVNKIRHVRIFVSANPMPIKKQTYLSKKGYKQDYYAANAENTFYGLYWDGVSKERGYECLNLFQVAKIQKTINPQSLEDYFEPVKLLGRGKNKIETLLYTVLKPGMKVLFYKESKEELLELKESASQLSKRLYVLNRIYSATTGQILFQHHLEARDDKDLLMAYPESEFGKKGKNGFSEFNYEFPWPRLLMTSGSFNFIIEKKDFMIMPDGKIKFKSSNI